MSALFFAVLVVSPLSVAAYLEHRALKRRRADIARQFALHRSWSRYRGGGA